MNQLVNRKIAKRLSLLSTTFLVLSLFLTVSVASAQTQASWQNAPEFNSTRDTNIVWTLAPEQADPKVGDQVWAVAVENNATISPPPKTDNAWVYVVLGVSVVFFAVTSAILLVTHKPKVGKSAAAVAVVGCMIVSMFAAFPVASADQTAKTGYKLATPQGPDYYICNYTDASIGVIRGSDWANLMTFMGKNADGTLITPIWAGYSTNPEAVWTQIWASVDYGVVYSKEVAPVKTAGLASWQADIPNFVEVQVSYQGNEYKFANPLNTVGSPYTVAVGAKMMAGYYTAEDADNRILWSSLNYSAVINPITKLSNQHITHTAGTFLLDSSIINDLTGQNNTFDGVGDGTVIKVADNTNVTAISLAQAYGWKIRNIMIDCNSANNVQGGGAGYLGSLYGEDNGGNIVDMHQNAIHIFNSTSCLIENVHVKDTVMHAINIHYTNWTTVQGCTVENAGKDSTYYSTQSAILVWNYGYNNKVLDNNIQNSKQYGVYSSLRCKYLSITGNDINITTGFGIQVMDGDTESIITENKINGNNAATCGINLDDANIVSGEQHRIICTDNIVAKIPTGIKLTLNGTASQITNNGIYNGTYGVYVENSTDSLIAGNTISNQSTAIYLIDGSNRNLIESNKGYNITSTGLLITGCSYNTAIGNDFTGKKGVALLNSANFNTIKSNTINIIPSAYIPAISLATGCMNNTLAGNTITGTSTWCAVHIDSDSDFNIITDTVEYSCTKSVIVANANCNSTLIFGNINFANGDIDNSGTGTIAFDNFNQATGTWITAINAPTGGR